MEQLRKSRKTRRSLCTRFVNQLKEQLAAEHIDHSLRAKIEANIMRVNENFQVLRDIDKSIFEAMLEDENVTDEQLEEEALGASEYEFEKNEVQALYNARKSKSVSEESASLLSARESYSAGGGRFRLPKIEWVKFSGDVKDWIRFWSQFESVHEDESLSPTDKYHYLVQATIPGSRAREIVDSFPPTKESYPKVIASLKSRFGREDLLVEHYQRELLKLVVQNIVQKGKIPLSQMYDKIETQINNLETLGVTKDKGAGLLYPLVESCLNEDLLRVWQRTPEYRGEPASDRRLDRLMEFLRLEVEGEVKIAAASSGLGLKEDSKIKKKKEDEVEEKVPTAASLVVGEHKASDSRQQRSKSSCIFCTKAHPSEHCLSARSMTLDQRSEKVKTSGSCFACLNKHRIADCRAKIKCIACDGRHLPILCRKLDLQKGNSSSGNPAVSALTSSCNMVLLQTLLIQVSNGKSCRTVRCLIDTGSQRSYVLTEVANSMKLVPSGIEKISHTVFGGSVSAVTSHNCYKLVISDLKGKNSYKLDVLDQKKICGSVPTSASGSWVQELAGQGIDITDRRGPIEVLLGADFCSQILTGTHLVLKAGLVAVKTLLGWTVMGKVPRFERVNVSTCSMLSTTIEPVPSEQLVVTGHYMPHRPVFRNSPATLIRPGLDASAKQVKSPPRNHYLSKGRNLLELRPSLMPSNSFDQKFVSSRWWEGPKWFMGNENNWPPREIPEIDESDNPMIRASRALTDKVSEVMGGLFQKT